MKLILRNYQETIVNNCRESFKNGYKKLCCVLPCGAGKTAIFCYLAYLNTIKKPNNRVLILLHRKELLKQTIEAFQAFQISTDHINIAMIQSFKNTLKNSVKPYSLIIIDECHHATSSSFKTVLNAYSKTALIGFTATPARLDGKPLGAIFDRLIVGVDYSYLIQNNYLVDYDYFSPDLNFNFSEWKLKSGDFDTKDNALHLDKKAIYGDILKYIDLSKKTIIYSPTVDYSKKLEAQINEHFKSSVAREFNATTPQNERNEIISSFKNGKIKILINVDLIGEGFNVPSCDCVFLLRATQSLTLYIQQAGRALRSDPNNPNKRASIFDFVGNIYRFGFPDAPRVWSLSNTIKNTHKHETAHDSLIIKTCPNCLRSFVPSQMLPNRCCPFCNASVPLNIREIKIQDKKELTLIKRNQLIENRRQRGKCRTFQQLKKLGEEKNYKCPAQWAFYVLKNRKKI
jgi:superfamily II DNA or RNA helicase|uniref:Chromatin remodeling complex ATPase n=1 Tax=Siphoviridae sp. ct43U4 TaxID=2826285 RepID=A0A8S5MZQ3_9CAUD|nr:MAG TPA: Chromatin remodeling complex ATPase [Siphoviridae sp. ct43U4]